MFGAGGGSELARGCGRGTVTLLVPALPDWRAPGVNGCTVALVVRGGGDGGEGAGPGTALKSLLLPLATGAGGLPLLSRMLTDLGMEDSACRGGMKGIVRYVCLVWPRVPT